MRNARSNQRRKESRKVIITFFPLAALLGLVFLKLQFNQIYHRVIQEDNIVEYLQSILYFAAALCAAVMVRRFLATGRYYWGSLYSILSLAFLVICLEEISWGQRLFGFKGTAYFIEHNVQREVSLHNLDFVHPYLHYMYVLVSGWGAFAWLLLPKRIRSEYGSTVGFVIPDRILFFYFVPAFVMYVYLSYLMVASKAGWIEGRATFHYFVTWRDQEPPELLLAMGFLLFVAMAYEGVAGGRQRAGKELAGKVKRKQTPKRQ